MENLTTKVRKSSKELGDHGLQFLTDTKQAGQTFVSFVQDEAKDWGEYLRHRYQNIGEQGRDLIKTENPRDAIKVHLDGLLGRVTGRAKTTEEQGETEEHEAADAADASTEEVNEAATESPTDEAEVDFADDEELEEDLEDEE